MIKCCLFGRCFREVFFVSENVTEILLKIKFFVGSGTSCDTILIHLWYKMIHTEK